jgi:hypothetical protein
VVSQNKIQELYLLKPIWAYGLELWSSAKPFNISPFGPKDILSHIHPDDPVFRLTPLCSYYEEKVSPMGSKLGYIESFSLSLIFD